MLLSQPKADQTAQGCPEGHLAESSLYVFG